MIILQIFTFSMIAGAGAYAGVAIAIGLHDLIAKWRRLRGLS